MAYQYMKTDDKLPTDLQKLILSYLLPRRSVLMTYGGQRSIRHLALHREVLDPGADWSKDPFIIANRPDYLRRFNKHCDDAKLRHAFYISSGQTAKYIPPRCDKATTSSIRYVQWYLHGGAARGIYDRYDIPSYSRDYLIRMRNEGRFSGYA